MATASQNSPAARSVERHRPPPFREPHAARNTRRVGSLVVRTAGDPGRLTSSLKATIRPALNRDPTSTQLLEDYFRRVTAVRRFNASLMMIFGIIAVAVFSALALVLRSPARERLVWTIGGLVLGFAILGGFSIGPAFLPAAGLLLLGGLVGDVISPRSLLLHVPLAVVACVLQVAAPLFVLHTLTPPL